MSYIDFDQAERISRHILQSEIYPGEPKGDRTLYEALNCDAIVAYWRPFSESDESPILVGIEILPNPFGGGTI